MTKKKDPKDKVKIGRPTKMTAETLNDLRTAFAYSFTDREACLYAGIWPTTLERYCQSNPDFRLQKEMLKEKPNMKGKMIVVGAMQGATDEKGKALYTDDQKSIAKWWLERKAKEEFSTKTETKHSGDVIIDVEDLED